MNSPHRPAFTLIELLVVVTIIVVLLALLAPAMDRAMRAASSAVCLSNEHQWGAALQQYSIDYKGARFAVTVGTGRSQYWARLAPYMGEPGLARRYPFGIMKAMMCPDAPARPGEGMDTPGQTSIQLLDNTTYIQGQGSKWGSASRAWYWIATANLDTLIYGSYGWNYWTLHTPEWGQPPQRFFGRLRNLPGDAVLMGDAIWTGSWPTDSDVPPTADPENGNAGTGWTAGGEMGRWAINRHPLAHMSVNIGFADGSARNVRLGELWALRWHKEFLPSRAYMDAYP